jgi:hypothetical protein
VRPPSDPLPTAAAAYGVAYSRTPRIGLIEPLHALDGSGNRRTMCGEPVAMCWSAEDSAETEIDCQRCLATMPQNGGMC